MKKLIYTIILGALCALPSPRETAGSILLLAGNGPNGGGSDNPGTTGLVAWYALDDASSPTTWTDEVGSFDLTKGGTVSSNTAQAKLTGCADFNGTDGVLYNGSFSNTFHQSDFTVGAWVRLDAAVDRSLIGQYGAGDARHWTLYYNGGAESYFELVMRNGAGTRIAARSATFSTTAEWIFVVATRSGDTLQMYLDGVASGTTDTFTGTEISQSQRLELGQITTSFFDGKLDEVFIYTKALTAAEISWLYNSDNGRRHSDL